jgi:hypothetical protein
MPSTPRIYHVTFTGEIGAAIRTAFSDLEVRTEQGQTVLSGELADQAALFGVLERIGELGLDLVDVTVEDL